MVNFKTPDGKFVFKAKAQASGERGIYLQYVLNGKPIFRTTGIAVREEAWDPVKQQIVDSSNPDVKRLNYQLKAFKTRVDTQMLQYVNNGHILTSNIIKQMLEGTFTTKENACKIDLVKYALEYNEHRYEGQEISEKTRYNHEKTIMAFANYLDNEYGDATLPFSSLNLDVIEKYKVYCVSKLKNKPQSVNKKLEPLSKAISYAAKNDLVPLSLATMIQEVRFEEAATRYSPDEEDEKVRFLSEEQMLSLLDIYNKVKYSRTRDFIDMFLFSFHACGLRVSDVITLEWRHVDFENHQLTKVLVKRKNCNTIPLNDAAISILKRWQARKLNDRFVFNMLPKNFNLKNDKLLTKTINNQNRKIRQSLNVVGEKLTPKFCGLGMHVARHTFAVMALNKCGVDLYTISRLLGHSSVLVTEKVYATFLADTLKKEVREKLSFTSFKPRY